MNIMNNHYLSLLLLFWIFFIKEFTPGTRLITAIILLWLDDNVFLWDKSVWWDVDAWLENEPNRQNIYFKYSSAIWIAVCVELRSFKRYCISSSSTLLFNNLIIQNTHEKNENEIMQIDLGIVVLIPIIINQNNNTYRVFLVFSL